MFEESKQNWRIGSEEEGKENFRKLSQPVNFNETLEDTRLRKDPFRDSPTGN